MGRANKFCLRCSYLRCKCRFNFLYPELESIFPDLILKKINRYAGNEYFTDKYCDQLDAYKNTLYRYYVPVNRRNVAIRRKNLI